MIELTNISKKFKNGKNDFYALSDVNLNVEKSEILGLMGPSGSGKTTLLNIIGGIYQPSLGEYRFEDFQVVGDETFLSKFRSQNIGFILQHFALIKNRTIFYNISLPLKYKKIESKEIKRRVVAIAKTLGIEDKLKKYPYMLSGGECQRVAIARAIVSAPKIILADEPTSSLDTANKQTILQILKQLNDEGMTIIIATHDSDVAKVCSRIINLKEGEIV